MQCHEFEADLPHYFKYVNAEIYQQAIVKDDLQSLLSDNNIHIALLQHASVCDNCTTSLWHYLRIRDKAELNQYPCFHLAYYCLDDEEKCIEFENGLFSIILDKADGSGIIIGYCPWCAKELNVSS